MTLPVNLTRTRADVTETAHFAHNSPTGLMFVHSVEGVVVFSDIAMFDDEAGRDEALERTAGLFRQADYVDLVEVSQ